MINILKFILFFATMATAASVGFTVIETSFLLAIPAQNLNMILVQETVNLVVGFAMAIAITPLVFISRKVFGGRPARPFLFTFILMCVVNMAFSVMIVINRNYSIRFFELKGIVLGLGVLIVSIMIGLGIYFAASRAIGSRQLGRMPVTASGIFLLAVILVNIWMLNSSGFFVGGAPASKAAQNNAPNVIIILLDALRYDGLQVYGNQYEVSPDLDSFIEESTDFSRAFAQSSWTRPSVASLLTGLYPNQHLVSSDNDALSNNIYTYVEAFRDYGYNTVGFSVNPQVSESTYMDQGFNMFDSFSLSNLISNSVYGYVLQTIGGRFLNGIMNGRLFRTSYGVSASEVFSRVENLLDSDPAGPFFIYIHLCDTHIPYQAPKSYLDKFISPDAPARTLDDVVPLLEPYAIKNTPFFDPDKGLKMDDSALRTLREMYNSEILYSNDEIRNFFDYLEARGFYEDSIIAMISDHGEDFGDHNHLMHGGTLYNSLVHVPMVVKFPKNRFAGKVATPVALFDLLPTIGDYVGMELPGDRQAVSRMSVLEGTGDDQPSTIFSYVYSEKTASGLTEIKTAIIDSDMKLIKTIAVDGNSTLWELYSMENDFDETDNIYFSNKEIADALIEKLLYYESLSYGVEAEKARFDQGAKDKLKQMGYIE